MRANFQDSRGGRAKVTIVRIGLGAVRAAGAVRSLTVAVQCQASETTVSYAAVPEAAERTRSARRLTCQTNMELIQ
jgi:hypothetical protein